MESSSVLAQSTGPGLCVRPLLSPDVGGVEDDAGDVDGTGVIETM